MAVNPVPEGFHTVTPYLLVDGVAKLLDFLKEAFDAVVMECITLPDGRVMHAQARIGDSIIMMGDPRGTCEPVPTTIYLYLPDCDAVYKKAIAAGGVSMAEPADMFYGDRHGGVKDPTGNTWWIATHVEDVSTAELKRRAEEHAKKQG